MAYAEDEHQQALIFYLADEPIISQAIFPKFSEARTLQRLSHAARIVQFGDSFLKEYQDALALLRIELAEFPLRRGGKLNLPGHDVSTRL